MTYASPTPHARIPPVVTNVTVTQDLPVITNVLTLMNVSLTITIVMLMPIVSIIMDHIIVPVNPDLPWSMVTVLTLTNALLVTTGAVKTVTVSTPMVRIDASARTVITATDIPFTMKMNVQILPVPIPRIVLIILVDLTVFALRATPVLVLSVRTSMNAIAIHVTIMHLVQIPPVHTRVPVIQDSLDPVGFALIVTSAEPVPTHQSSTCHNKPDGYDCECGSGFQGDGFSCYDVNECLQSPCGENSKCINTIGSHRYDRYIIKGMINYVV